MWWWALNYFSISWTRPCLRGKFYFLSHSLRDTCSMVCWANTTVFVTGKKLLASYRRNKGLILFFATINIFCWHSLPKHRLIKQILTDSSHQPYCMNWSCNQMENLRSWFLNKMAFKLCQLHCIFPTESSMNCAHAMQALNEQIIKPLWLKIIVT